MGCRCAPCESISIQHAWDYYNDWGTFGRENPNDEEPLAAVLDDAEDEAKEWRAAATYRYIIIQDIVSMLQGCM